MQKFDVHGKWILAGEHSVLRGCPALVFPVRSRQLTLEYSEKDTPFSVEFDNDNNDLHIAFWAVFEKALQTLGLERSALKGKMKISNSVPIGAGMGASATLCVALGKWLAALGRISETSIFDLAKSLEDLFHGQSSGVDVAVALHNRPLLFHCSGEMQNFEPSWQPHIYLSYCGKRGVTSDCVRKVHQLIDQDPKKGEEIDQEMQKSVEWAKQALIKENDIELLSQAFQRAKSCFHHWGLLSNELSNHMAELEKFGVLATKPTGSGDGGYVLSLWPTAPPQDIPFELIQA